MTDEEIFVSYRDAKQKGEQVKILSELALKPVEEIIEILIKKGVPAKAFSRFKGMTKTEYIAQGEIAKCLEEKNEIIKALQDDIESLRSRVDVAETKCSEALAANIQLEKQLDEKEESLRLAAETFESFGASVNELEAELREVTQNYTKAVEHSQELQRIIDEKERFGQPDKVTKTLVSFALAKIEEMTKSADV